MHAAHTDPWYTDEDFRRIRIAKSFPPLVEVAIQAIARNRRPNEPVIQVCGPMTTGDGTFKENNERIVRTIVRLRDEGKSVFSQVVFQEGMLNFTTIEDYHRDPLRLLEGFYGALFRGGHIQTLVFLPGSRKSLGCRWEESMGRKLGMDIILLPDEATKPHVLFSLPQALF